MTLKFTLFPEIFKELLAVSARLDAWREREIYNSSYWARQEHEVADNTSAAADRYLAHHPEIQQQMEAEAEAGAAEQYSVLHNVAKRPFGISISERLYLFSRTPSGAPNGSPALTYKWTTQLLKEIAPPWPLDLSEGHGGGPGVVGDEQH